jgi:hypothetical protein
MRLFRYAILAALLTVPVLVAAAPAAYAADSIGTIHAWVTPSQATPGARVTFAVNCGRQMSAGATLFGTTLGLPQQIPMSQDASGNFSISVDLPVSIQAGTYHPSIDCSGGSSTTVTLIVTAFPSGGGAATGDGTTSTTSSNTLPAAGMVLVGGGAIVGGYALRRRKGRQRG